MITRRLIDKFFKLISILAALVIIAVLASVLWVVVSKGLKTLSLDMFIKPQTADFLLGGGGGIANAILGSLYIGLGATLLALLISLPTVLYMRNYADGSKFADFIRFSLDVLWGVPSIVIGIFGFLIMVYLGIKASLLAAIITVAVLELPIMIRAIDEVASMIPRELDEAAYNLGSTTFEVSIRVVAKQILPGIASGILLAFGRGIGDAASVLFTAGYTNNMPKSIFDQVATLPITIFSLLGNPMESVRAQAYGAALILVIIVLIISIASRFLGARLSRNIIR